MFKTKVYVVVLNILVVQVNAVQIKSQMTKKSNRRWYDIYYILMRKIFFGCMSIQTLLVFIIQFVSLFCIAFTGY